MNVLNNMHEQNMDGEACIKLGPRVTRDEGVKVAFSSGLFWFWCSKYLFLLFVLYYEAGGTKIGQAALNL